MDFWLYCAKGYELYGTEARINKYGERIVATNQCLWLTNIEHGRRHKPLILNTMAENIKHNKHKTACENLYQKYDNYDAIEVPYTDLIPRDYEGVMGVPITFLDKYCPEQFELLGCSYIFGDCEYHKLDTDWNCYLNGERIFKRLFIRRR